MPPEDRRTLLDERERIPEARLELELPPEMPDAALPAVAETAANLPVGGDAPGRLVAGDEARAALAGMNVPAEVGAAAARVAAAVADARDEIDDATAMRLANRAFAPQAPVQGVPEPRPPTNPDNLPDVLRSTVFDPNRRTNRPPQEPRWMQVYQLPRYLQQGIRALGRSVFDAFPCFATQRDDARAKGEDALGSIQVLANIQGGGPSRPSDLDVVATWIRANGVPIEAAVLELPFAIPGYRPRIVLAASEERSYLMVDERREDGAPADAQYIYSWAGGQVHYLQNPDHFQRLAGVAEGGAARRIAPPPARLAGRVADVPQRPRHLPPPAQPVRPLAALAEGEVKDDRDKKLRLSTLEAAPVAAGGLIASLRRLGFQPNGPQATPSFRKRLEDGGHADLLGRPGILAAQHDSFQMSIFDATGTETWSGSVSSSDEAAEAFAAASGPRPR